MSKTILPFIRSPLFPVLSLKEAGSSVISILQWIPNLNIDIDRAGTLTFHSFWPFYLHSTVVLISPAICNILATSVCAASQITTRLATS